MAYTVKENIVKLFLMDSLICATSDNGKLEDFMMKKHGITKEVYKEYHTIYIDFLQTRSAVLGFAMAMEEKLKEKDEKAGWGGLKTEDLTIMLSEEVCELQDEVVKKEPKEIGKEAVDVGNYAMMVWDKQNPYVHGK